VSLTVLAEGNSYPLLDLFWTMLEIFLWVVWFFLLFRVIGDIFRSEDLSGGGKAGWTILVIIVPFLGILIYLIVRGRGMGERDRRAAQAADQQMRTYIQSASTSSTSTAEELHKLADLRDRGVLSQQEFDAQKAKLLA
jgi:hypothetical protein